MNDHRLFIEVTWDDQSADATLVLFHERAPMPVEAHTAMFSLDVDGDLPGGWDAVRDLCVALAEHL
jgi:hypothetical protein